MSYCATSARLPKELAELKERLEARAVPLRGLAEHYALLAGETRLKIIALLTDSEELCVCDLARVLQMTPAAVSQHLSRLRSGRLVQSRRDGMTIFYRLTDRAVALDMESMLRHEPAAGE